MLYVAIFIVVFIFYLVTVNTAQAHNPIYLGFTMLGLCLVVGFSDMLGGYDRYIYGEIFDRAADDINVGIPILTQETGINAYHSELAYVIWNIIVAHITENRYVFILLSTIFMYVLIFKSLKDYIDDNYFFAVLAFLGLWFFFTFTYLRQAMATSVAWFSMRYVIKRKPIPFFICAFIVYKFHNSGILLFPFYFLPLKKWSSTSVVATMFVLFLIGSTGVTSSLYGLYADINSEREQQDYDLVLNNRWAYAIEVVVFLYLILKRYSNVRSDKDIVMMNAVLCFCGLLLLFIRNSSAGRQSWYFLIGVIVLLTHLYSKKTVSDRSSLIVIGVLFALFLRIVITWGDLVSPYKTFFSDGYRPEDQIIDNYEYDWKYEQDKMYRKPFRITLKHWQ